MTDYPKQRGLRRGEDSWFQGFQCIGPIAVGYWQGRESPRRGRCQTKLLLHGGLEIE